MIQDSFVLQGFLMSCTDFTFSNENALRSGQEFFSHKQPSEAIYLRGLINSPFECIQLCSKAAFQWWSTEKHTGEVPFNYNILIWWNKVCFLQTGLLARSTLNFGRSNFCHMILTCLSTTWCLYWDNTNLCELSYLHWSHWLSFRH